MPYAGPFLRGENDDRERERAASRVSSGLVEAFDLSFFSGSMLQTAVERLRFWYHRLTAHVRVCVCLYRDRQRHQTPTFTEPRSRSVVGCAQRWCDHRLRWQRWEKTTSVLRCIRWRSSHKNGTGPPGPFRTTGDIYNGWGLYISIGLPIIRESFVPILHLVQPH